MDRVQFAGVSKRYEIGERATNLREAVSSLSRRVTGRRGGEPERRVLWSLRDVDLAVADGEALGILGRNGAGKSTALKIMTRITTPTSGVARTRGRVASLLEVGTGFHPELTGRENVHLNGAILGMSRRSIDREFDSIVDFAGVERFLDTPVKRYSSGMYLRLAFAVAAHLEPDILVVDEILAVGDAEFQRKCLGRMAAAEAEGRTIVFVSHDLDTLAKVCSRAVWLDAGRVRREGPTADLVREYLGAGVLGGPGPAAVAVTGGPVTVTAARVLAERRPDATVLLREDALRIEVDLTLAEEVPGFDVAVYVTRSGGIRVLDEGLGDRGTRRLGPGAYRVSVPVPPVLNVGEYTLGVWVGSAYDDLLDEPAAATFTLHGEPRRTQRAVVLGLPVAVEALVAD